MSHQEAIATGIKLEQLELFKKKKRLSYQKASTIFDRYRIWEFVDEAFEGLHVQGPLATYEDITAYIKNTGGSV
ncbi:hypothetical protein AGMMS49928_13720 [Spirochaetia bacterium]|nr:hypothetical protein AGMMS49928_13720 [Spirochaetia bacterium]